MLRDLSSEKVAAIIKADLKGSAGGYEYGEYTEHGYEDARTKEREARCLRDMKKSREQGSVFSERESGGADPRDPAGFLFLLC